MSAPTIGLERVSRATPSFRGEWRAVHYQPEIASPQRFIVGVLVGQAGTVQAWRLLSEFDRLHCVYGSRLDAKTLSLVFSRVSGLLFRSVESQQPMPELESLSPQWSLGPALYCAGESAEEAAVDLYQTIVAVQPSERGAPKFASKSTETVRDLVNKHLKLRLALNFERVILQDGYLIHRKGKVVHHLDVNIYGNTRVGSVHSAWYGSRASVELQTLRTTTDLAAAAAAFSLTHQGLFLLRPLNPVGISRRELDDIDDFIDKLGWKLAQQGATFEVQESPEALADAVTAFVKPDL